MDAHLTSDASIEVELSDAQKYATAALFTLVLHATASRGGQTINNNTIQNSPWGISSEELQGGPSEGLHNVSQPGSSEPHQASAPESKSYHLGDLTRKLGATITGDKDYQIGDLTKRVLFGSQRSCTSLSVVEQVKEPVQKKSYRLGDLTRKYIDKDYQCGDLTKRFLFGAEAVNKAKEEKKYLLEQQNDEPNEPYDDKTVEGAFYCKEGWGSQLVREMLPDLYIRLGVPIQEHYRLLSLPRPASTAVLAIVDRKEAAEDSWDTILATLAQDSAIYAKLLDPQLSEPGLLLAAITHHHSHMKQDAPSTLSLLEALHYAQSQSQMPADASSIKCSSETRQMHPCVWVAVQNLLHGITSPPVQKKALLASTVPPSAPCWYFYDARARVAFHYVATMLQMPFSTVLDMENKHAADLARQSLQYTNAGAAVPVMGSAANTANFVAGSSGAGAVTTAGFNYCGASRVAGSAARGMVGGGVQQYGFLELSGNHPMQQPVQGYKDTTLDGAIMDWDHHQDWLQIEDLEVFLKDSNVLAPEGNGGFYSTHAPPQNITATSACPYELPAPKLLRLPQSTARDSQPCMSVTICVSGFLTSPASFTTPWTLMLARPSRRLSLLMQHTTECYSLVFDASMLSSVAWSIQQFAKDEGLKRAAISSSGVPVVADDTLALPSASNMALESISSPWQQALRRAEDVGVMLGRQLAAGVAGGRPVTLMGYSVGARVLYHALLELSRLGCRGIIECAILMGCPVSATETLKWAAARAVVAGRMVNAYAPNDLTLSVAYSRYFRLNKTLNSVPVAGLCPVALEGIENVDVGYLISEHQDYEVQLPRLVPLLL